MLGERIVTAIQRHVLKPGETMVRHVARPGEIIVLSDRNTYFADPADDWAISRHPGVEGAFRVVVDHLMENFVVTYGLLVPAGGGEVLLLNDTATLRGLADRLGGPVEPLAYAELLAELCSGRDVDKPVVYPTAAVAGLRAGWLVRDVGDLRTDFPEVEAASIAPPMVRAAPPGVEFCSHNYFLLEGLAVAIDLYRWSVDLPARGPARWDRQVIERELRVRPWRHDRPATRPTG